MVLRIVKSVEQSEIQKYILENLTYDSDSSLQKQEDRLLNGTGVVEGNVNSLVYQNKIKHKGDKT